MFSADRACDHRPVMREPPTILALVPVKDLRQAKQRLAGVLDAGERHALFRVMLEDVLSVLATCRSLAGIVLVTRDGHDVLSKAAPKTVDEIEALMA